MKEIITSCTCDCPDTCSILARVEGDRVVSLRGNPDFEYTRGFLCRKSRGFLKRVFSKDRILHPLRRTDSGWERVSWDDAASLVAGKMEEARVELGPLSVFYYKDAGSISALKQVNEALFNLRGGGTFASGSLCGGAGIAGQTADLGYRTSHDPKDLLNSSLIVIWGRNPAWTNVHLVPILKQARERGARIVLVDPLRTATAELVDTYISPVPGTDAYLALGVARCLLEEGLVDRGFLEHHTEGSAGFLALTQEHSLKNISEVTGLTINEIREFALLYGRHRPAAIIGGWGLQRRRNGANTYRFLDALGALTGNIGIRGGGVSHGMDETRWFDKRVNQRASFRGRREIPRPRTGRGLLEAVDPPVKVAVVSGANPVNQCPDVDTVRGAFERTEFVVVIDMFMTDTARLADVVLPATHFLQERDVVASYWHNYVMPVNAAQPRLGEEKTDLEVFALIAEKLGIGDMLANDPDRYLRQMLAPLACEGITLERILEGPVRPSSAVDVPYEDRTFSTASGKFEFVRTVSELPELAADAYPYHLITPHPRGRNHSQLWGELEAQRPSVRVADEVARGLGVKQGETVTVETLRGRLECEAVIDSSLRADTVVIYEGWWDQLGGSANRLTSDVLSDMGESATYYDVRCRVLKSG
jgi:anaerobic selenocysteine-containing dehydrogenase